MTQCAEERALPRQTAEHRVGRAAVAVGAEVVAAERVHPDQHDPLRRAHVGGIGSLRAGVPAPAHRGRPPEPERPRLLGRDGERELHRPPRPARQVHRQRLPAVRRRDRALEERLVAGADAEAHRPLLHRPQPHVEEGARRRRHLEGERFRRARHQRLAVDLPQTLPAHPRGDAGQVLAAGDEADGGDLEARAGDVGRPQEEVAELRRRLRPRRAQREGLELAPGDQRARHPPGKLAGEFQDLLEVELLAAAEGEAEVAAGRDLEPHLDGVEHVAAQRFRRLLEVDQREVGRRAPGEETAAQAQLRHPRPGFPVAERERRRGGRRPGRLRPLRRRRRRALQVDEMDREGRRTLPRPAGGERQDQDQRGEAAP